jgi:beta-1,4-mannosyl-glycoprotein beta-1,4-N-acetylglucosaminyltransferase
MLSSLLRRRRYFRLLSTAFFAIVVILYYSHISIEAHKAHNTHKIDDDNAVHTSTASKTNNHGFLSLEDAEPYCEAHNWKPYPKRDSRRKIYDLFMLNGEMDWLELRLNELQYQVDYFVIVESNRTFTGLPKPLNVVLNWEKLQPFHNKIIYHILENSISSTRTWDHEDLQRNAMYDQVLPNLVGEQAPQLGDVILVSDVDEIPRPASLTVLRNCDYNRRLTLRSRFYYYSFQWLHEGEEWPHPQATYYEGENTIRPADLRNGEGGSNTLMRKLEKADLDNAAWHCSSCFATLWEMQNKMSSFSHTALNKEQFRERAGIIRRVRNGHDLFDRPNEFYDRIEHNTDIPFYLKANKDKFSYMLNRDMINANFWDVTPEEEEEQRKESDIAAQEHKDLQNSVNKQDKWGKR